MANIYDLAKIASGDPIGRVKEGAREADALFAQYQHQKDIIKEINDAIAEGKRRKKKSNPFLKFLSSAIPDIIEKTPFMNILPGGKFLKPIMAGLIGGITEKFSQDQARATAPLKRVKAKLKNRKQEKDVGQTIDLFDRMGDDSILSSIISSALSEAIIPSKGAAPGETIMEDIPVKDSGDIMKAMDYKGGPGAPKGFSTENIDIPGLRDINLEPKLNYSADVLDEAIIPTKSFPKSIAEATLGKPSLSLNEEMLGGLVPGFDFEGVGSEFQGEKGQAFLKLLKYLGPLAYQELFKPKPLIDSYTQPQFRNPYRGGY